MLLSTMSSLAHVTLAHADEAHGTGLSAAIHELAWHIQLPTFILIVAIIGSILWLATKKVDTTVLITSFILLVSGFGLFQLAPLVSALSIIIGMIMTLFVTFIGLGHQR